MSKLVLRRIDRNNEEMLVNFGPQHPSTHGVLNFLVETDGEVMRRAIPDIGYLHRSLEKIGEMVGYPGYMPYTDRIDYLAAMFANEGYAIAVEKLIKVEVPPRAQYLRAISCELNRIASHLVSIGTMATDIGAVTPLVYALREREAINDLVEALCGARLTYNYHRIGGVAFDAPEGWRDRVLKFLDRFDSLLQEWDRLITWNEIYLKRLGSVAVITARAGHRLRPRRPEPPRLRRRLGRAPRHALRRLPGLQVRRPDRPWLGRDRGRRVRPLLRPRAGDGAVVAHRPPGAREAARRRVHGQGPAQDQAGGGGGHVPRRVAPAGEMAYYVVSDGTERAYRVRARTGSFLAMGIIEDISSGLMIADLVALIASLDVVAPETDR